MSERTNEPIRLTNNTARALRDHAKLVRSLCNRCAIVLTVLLALAAVGFGVMWLPAAPICVCAAALVDALLLLYGRGRWLSLMGQALCAENAARSIRAARQEQLRRMQAEADLAVIKADVAQFAEEPERTPENAEGRQPHFEPEHDNAQAPTGATQVLPRMVHAKKQENARRRRQNGLHVLD